jgi:uncharacterized membrane protein
MDDSRREAQKETGRVESFSDGVIAIAITLLILEIKIPKPDEIASVSLFIKLLDLWPSFLAFVTSFATILVMWANHHRVFRLVRTTDYPFLSCLCGDECGDCLGVQRSVGALAKASAPLVRHGRS